MSGGSLAVCAYDWVGGNFSGLQALEGQCSAVAATLTNADHALSRQVSQIVGAGGWSGSAADAFTSAWDKDSTAGAQLAGAWRQIGTIAANLAADLASLENALEEAAFQLEQQGVAVDPADGTALPGTTAGGLACPSPQVAASNAGLASQYMAYRAQVLAQASAVRAQAALSLNAITESLLPAQAGWGDGVNGLDAVRSLWAVPTTYRRAVVEDLAQAEKNVNLTQRTLWEQYIARKAVQGKAARVDSEDVDSAREALAERSALRGKLADAPAEDASTRLADGDAAGLGLAGAAAERSAPSRMSAPRRALASRSGRTGSRASPGDSPFRTAWSPTEPPWPPASASRRSSVSARSAPSPPGYWSAGHSRSASATSCTTCSRRTGEPTGRRTACSAAPSTAWPTRPARPGTT